MEYARKFLMFLLTIFLTMPVMAQTALPHGMVFGSKPDTTVIISAANLEKLMGKKKRITTVIKGKVARVTANKGGWFELQTGNGETISAHFKDYSVNLPAAIKGRIVIVEGVAKRWFPADDKQHYAGDTVKSNAAAKLSRGISFEVKGLLVYQ